SSKTRRVSTSAKARSSRRSTVRCVSSSDPSFPHHGGTRVFAVVGLSAYPLFLTVTARTGPLPLTVHAVLCRFGTDQEMKTMQKVCHHEMRNAFRALLARPACFQTASVFDPLSARIAADLGFEVGILGGSVASLQVLAAPDIALITLSEFAEQATRIGRVARLPVIADADHGYGNALNAMRTVTELERAGVAALTLEDT